jgi:hypothetical protein
MQAEELVDNPPEVIHGGEEVSYKVPENNVDFTSFVSKELNDGSRYTLVSDEGTPWKDLTWWEIALPLTFIVFLVIIVSCLIC